MSAWIATAVVVLFMGGAHAQTVLAPRPLSCQALFSTAEGAVAKVLSKLQQPGAGVLINQYPFLHLIEPGGGGACATVTAVNLIQGLRALSGELSVVEPREMVLDAYDRHPQLRGGRVSNDQFTDLLLDMKRYLPKRDFTVRLDANARSFDFDTFDLQAGEMKVVIYRVYNAGNKLLGRHFVVLKARLTESSLAFVDPNRPEKTYEYSLKKSPFASRRRSALELYRPTAAKPTGSVDRYVVDSILSVQLAPNI